MQIPLVIECLEHAKSVKILKVVRIKTELAKNQKALTNTKENTNKEIIKQDIQMLKQLPQNGLIQLIFGRYADELINKKELKRRLQHVLKLVKNLELATQKLK